MYLNTNKNKYEIIMATTFFKRLFGLMGQKNIQSGLLFPKCNSIHTFFFFFNIYIFVINSNFEVIYKYENLPPNKIIKIKNDRKKTSILELPKHASQKIKVGTIIILNED